MIVLLKSLQRKQLQKYASCKYALKKKENYIDKEVRLLEPPPPLHPPLPFTFPSQNKQASNYKYYVQ